MDHLSRRSRSENMRRIRSKDTGPEKIVKLLLKRKGIKYSSYRKELPGKPDFLIKDASLALFVHGCFWHHHEGCRRSNIPKSNKGYWIPKIQNNLLRDRKNTKLLRKNGLYTAIIWECQTKKEEVAGLKIDRLFKKYETKYRALKK